MREVVRPGQVDGGGGGKEEVVRAEEEGLRLSSTMITGFRCTGVGIPIGARDHSHIRLAREFHVFLGRGGGGGVDGPRTSSRSPSFSKREEGGREG